MKKIIFLIFVLITQLALAQCPTITCVSTLTLTNCTSGQTIAATSNYSANITSRWIGPGNLNIASVGTATSVVNINHIGTYTVEFKDNFSNCVVQDTVAVSATVFKPTFSFQLSSNNLLCFNSTINVNILNAQSTPTPGGAMSYTLMMPFNSTIFPPPSTGTLSTYTLSTCGIIVPIVKDPGNNCLSSFSVSVGCSTLAPQSLTISGTNTVCQGSSLTFTANGSNHTWNTGATSSTMNTIPTMNTTYVVYGNDPNGCASSGSVNVNVNSTCSDVWPGDANSDGIVNNLDVFEIGLAFSSTGPLRSPGGNTYISQFANNWSGTVSTGKNKCHADCNGNGLVNNIDTMAIYNNYNLNHSFKSLESFSAEPDISIQSFPAIANEGMWNKADIVLGTSNNPMNQMYGVAFDVNYDPSVIEADSVYLVYASSFLNSGTTNVPFRKTSFTQGKVYAANVRTDGNDVSGEGKIGEFWFKLKSGLPLNSEINLSVSNSSKINSTGASSSISSGSTALNVVSNLVGIEERNLQNTVFFFPNPTSNVVTFQSVENNTVSYYISDILGREILNGEFVSSKTIDLSSFVKGTYFIRFESGELQLNKKLVIE